MKTVLVTGATGFIGRHCLQTLHQHGYRVCAVTSRPIAELDTDAIQEGIEWHSADLLDNDQVSTLMESVRPTHLLHFAWYAVPGKYWTAGENFRWVQATLSLLQAFESVGGKRAVSAGTCAEYDWRYGACVENTTPTTPATVYGTCKSAMQSMQIAFCRQAGISSAWGRIFFLYGPHEHPKRLVSSVINSLLRQEPADCSHGNQIRDLMHVEDVADAFAALLDSDVEGSINIASGRPVALRDVIYKIADRLQQPDLIRLGVVPVAPQDPLLLAADTRRLQEEVRWKPRYDLDSGLEQTIHWWQEQHLK